MLYQLGKGLNINEGEIVLINGPFDKYGLVIEKLESGYFLIRGLGMKHRQGKFISV